MQNYRIEYISDKYTSDPDKKCDRCNGLYVCVTKCCNKKLCQFCVRHGLQDALFMSCESCETSENLDDVVPLGFVIIFNNVYCEEHNILTECKQCESMYYCNDHYNNHECCESIEYEPDYCKSLDSDPKCCESFDSDPKCRESVDHAPKYWEKKSFDSDSKK